MENIVRKLMDDKKEYRAQMARVQVLPEGYQFVYNKIQDYIWSFAGGMGMDMLKTQYDLIDLFEEGAAQSKHVLEITGEDVAAFADGLLCGNRLWTDSQRQKLNRDLHRRLGCRETSS